MKRPFLALVLALLVLPQLSSGQTESERKPVKLHLVDGDTITGTVSAVKDGSLSVITEFGVIRVPVSRLTETSRKEVGVSSTATVDQLQKRVTELEAVVERLRSENSELRRQQAAAPSAPATRVQPLVGSRDGGGPPAATGTTAPSGATSWISSTGKRHNARCRYYATGKGRSGTPSEGVACKICGG